MTAATAAADQRLPLAEHIREARSRLVRSMVALMVCTVVGYLLSEQILDVLREPVEALSGSRLTILNYDTLTGAFDLKLKIAMFAGITLSSPVWLYQIFAYLSPGLTRQERRNTLAFLAGVLPLFAAGCVAGFFLFPHMVDLLINLSSTDDATILQASYYVDFVMKIVVASGVAFTLPAFVVMLNRLGVLPAAALRRCWRVVVVAIVVFSALVTPAADVLSMLLVASAMTTLFGVAYLITYLHDRALRREGRGGILPGAPDTIAGAGTTRG